MSRAFSRILVTVAIGAILSAGIAHAQSVPSSCPSAAAQDSLNSSLQQLAEVADGISLQNLPQDVLSADENLVSAISQVILQVQEACLPVGEPSSAETSPVSVQSSALSAATPTTVVVTTSALNVRSSPSAAAPIAAHALTSGDTFTAVNEVTGESVDGNDLWYVSSSGDYLWSGGAQPEALLSGAAPASGSGSAAPVITGIQGYNAANGAYTNGVVTSNQYLILYGTFTSSGNSVSINGQAVSASSITAQTDNQINVLLGDLTTGPASLSVTVTDANGTSQT